LASSKERFGSDGNWPIEALIDSLAKPKQVDGQEQSTHIRQRQSVIREAIIVVATGEIGVYFINDCNTDDGHDNEADYRSQVSKTDIGLAEAVRRT
jgi:hypothetical protein